MVSNSHHLMYASAVVCVAHMTHHWLKVIGDTTMYGSAAPAAYGCFCVGSSKVRGLRKERIVCKWRRLPSVSCSRQLEAFVVLCSPPLGVLCRADRGSAPSEPPGLLKRISDRLGSPEPSQTVVPVRVYPDMVSP